MGFLAKMKARSDVGESKKIVVLEGENLPTDTLKEVIGDAFVLVTNVFRLRDSFADALIQMAVVVGKYSSNPDVFRIAFDQFKDLDVEEASVVTEYVIEKFDIENDEVEKDIEDVLRIPAKAFAAIESVKTTFDSVSSIVNDDTKNGWEKADSLANISPSVVAEVKYVVDFVKESLGEIGDLTGGSSEQ